MRARIHDAAAHGDRGTVRLRLHVSKTSNRLEPAACELELVTFYRVDDCDGLKRKIARHDDDAYKGITPLADVSVRKSVVEGFSAFKLAAAGALVDAPEGAEAYRGRARDFELGKALNGLCEGDIALVEAAIRYIARRRVIGPVPTVRKRATSPCSSLKLVRRRTRTGC